MEKNYDSNPVEKKWYARWEEAGCFTADPHAEGEPYSIVIPPPNVTGRLHIGHALNNSIQDILIRWKRMSGYNAVWIPGRGEFKRQEFIGFPLLSSFYLLVASTAFFVRFFKI
jgi:valyl-tRNA synthetase